MNFVFKKEYPLRRKQGFTIIELVISIFVLSIAVVGIFSAFSIVTILTSDSADRLTATYLAQEGMELVRNVRDTNWLDMDELPLGGSLKWTDSLTSCVSGSGCEADYTLTGSGAIHVGSEYLKIDSSGGVFYNYTTGTPTKFKRKIIITCLPNNDCDNDYIMKAVVQVSWDQKATLLNPGYLASDYGISSVSNGITTESTLYNWYNYISAQQ